MHRVLIWKNIAPGSEYDIFRQVDLKTQYQKMLSDGTFNVGNRLWFQGIVSAVDTKENCYSYLTPELTEDQINESFDFIILPMANIFNVSFRRYLEEFARRFRKIRIPTYIIACGAQASGEEELENLIEQIGDVSKAFISAIYDGGGEFALRGMFTKEFFTRLGFDSAVVTGCPSLYQMGRAFQIPTEKQEWESVRPVFNGNISLLEKLLEHYSESIFVGQDSLLPILAGEKKGSPSFRDACGFEKTYGLSAAKLLARDRIRIIPDMRSWNAFLCQSPYNYSFGSRIHGNIMALLSGIPATVVGVDTRTVEMGEFFSIPYIRHIPGHVYTLREMEEIYDQMDYSRFNREFADKFDRYEAFLIDNGIVSHVNTQNAFLDAGVSAEEPMHCSSTDYYSAMAAKIGSSQKLIRALNRLRG